MSSNTLSKRIVILSSNQLCHNFFINHLVANHNVVGVIIEEKKRDPLKKDWGEYQEQVQNYFKQRTASEQSYFAENGKVDLPEDKILQIEGGQLNERFVLDKMGEW